MKIESTEDKLNWMFEAFDVDNGGTITVSEIKEIVIYLFKAADIEEEEDLLVACLSDIKSVDTGQLTGVNILSLGKLSTLTMTGRLLKKNSYKMLYRVNF